MYAPWVVRYEFRCGGFSGTVSTLACCSIWWPSLPSLLLVDVFASLLSPCKSDPTISCTTRMSFRPLVRLITPMLAEAVAEWKTYVGAQTVCLQSDLRQQERNYSTRGDPCAKYRPNTSTGCFSFDCCRVGGHQTSTHPNLISSRYTPPASRIEAFLWPGEMKCTYLHNGKATTGKSVHFSLQGALGENQSDKKEGSDQITSQWG